jgi:hypothetical protein
MGHVEFDDVIMHLEHLWKSGVDKEERNEQINHDLNIHNGIQIIEEVELQHKLVQQDNQ